MSNFTKIAINTLFSLVTLLGTDAFAVQDECYRRDYNQVTAGQSLKKVSLRVYRINGTNEATIWAENLAGARVSGSFSRAKSQAGAIVRCSYGEQDNAEHEGCMKIKYYSGKNYIDLAPADYVVDDVSYPVSDAGDYSADNQAHIVDGRNHQLGRHLHKRYDFFTLASETSSVKLNARNRADNPYRLFKVTCPNN